MSFDEINRLTIPEYNILMRALELRNIDEANERHNLAWLIMAAGAMKKDGKPVYKNYTDFFDYEAKLRTTERKPSKFSRLSKHLKEKKNGNK